MHPLEARERFGFPNLLDRLDLVVRFEVELDRALPPVGKAVPTQLHPSSVASHLFHRLAV